MRTIRQRFQISTRMTNSSEVPMLLFLQRRLQIIALFAIALPSRAVYAQSPAAIDLLRGEFVTKEYAVKLFGPIQQYDGVK